MGSIASARSSPLLARLIRAAVLCYCAGASQAAAADAQLQITRPGTVALDAPARHQELRQAGALSAMCSAAPLPIPVLTGVHAPDGYGLDKAFIAVDKGFRAAAARCLAAEETACRDIQAAARRWSAVDLRTPEGGPNGRRYWNDTLTVNLRLLTPMMTALSVSEAFHPMPATDREAIAGWAKRALAAYAHGMRNGERYKDLGVPKSAHNHAIGSSLAAMSYGAWAGDEQAFAAGIEQWTLTLSSMRADGSLPIETRRGARALYYQGRAIAGLIAIAERARAQGIDLYTRAPDPEKSLHHAIAFLIRAVENPEIVMAYAKANVAPGPTKDYRRQHLGGASGSTFAWVAPYMARFPGHANTRALRSLDAGASDLVPALIGAVNRGAISAEWIGGDAKCFYARPPK
jgi:poly(beta-D-mannuronate) lyase